MRMITVPDPTPEERERLARAMRRNAVMFAALGGAFVVLALVRAGTTGYHNWFDYGSLAYGPAYLIMGALHWRRAATIR